VISKIKKLKKTLDTAGVVRDCRLNAYNDHDRLLPPEPLVVEQPKFTRVEGADIVMKSSAKALV
jgi:hypothetical protein